MSLPPIIDAQTAAARDDVVWCDVRWYLDGRHGVNAYLEGHIPGAVFVDLDEHLTAPPRPSAGRHPLPAPISFAASLGSLGIGVDDPVVAYDDSGGMAAGRLVWMLRLLGQPAALLDGGIDGWPGELETTPHLRPPVDTPIRDWPEDLIVDADETQAAIDRGEVVIDARATERYRGDTEPVDRKPGHIPGAVNLPFAANLGDDGRFADPNTLRERFTTAGVGPDASSTTVYCGSGVSACHNLLAMEHAGLGRGRLYVGSWSQWSRDDTRPVATGDE